MTMTELKTESEAREFWGQLDEKTRLVLAKTAPVVVKAWDDRTGYCLRLSADSDWEEPSGAVVVEDASRPVWKAQVDIVDPDLELGEFTTVEAAKSACDTKLRELGFVLEDD